MDQVKFEKSKWVKLTSQEVNDELVKRVSGFLKVPDYMIVTTDASLDDFSNLLLERIHIDGEFLVCDDDYTLYRYQGIDFVVESLEGSFNLLTSVEDLSEISELLD